MVEAPGYTFNININISVITCDATHLKTELLDLIARNRMHKTIYVIVSLTIVEKTPIILKNSGDLRTIFQQK
jgi:hypothetical protein